jgi:hypothetical protein
MWEPRPGAVVTTDEASGFYISGIDSEASEPMKIDRTQLLII